jgi:hypothetical protein
VNKDPFKEYTVIRSNRRSFAAEIRGNQLLLRVPRQATDRQIKDFVRRKQGWIESHLAKAQEQKKVAESYPKLTGDQLQALAVKASKVIPERVHHYAPIVGVTYGKITIRKQRTRWGSCSSKGNLNFNCLLMLTPPEVLDSVVVHELCHRKEMNHSDKFYNEVLRVFPDYWKWDRWLKDNGSTLMAMME